MNTQQAAPDLAGALRREAADRGLFERVRRLLIGCSGGADSVVLTHLLHAAAAELGIELVVGHLDHGLRGEAGAADADFVEALADRLGLPFSRGRAEAVTATGAASEARLRERRLRFFAHTCQERRCDAVALGHTLDDQAEGVLLSVARGTGPRGLSGMRHRRRVNGTLLIRPLLGVARHEVRAWARAQTLEWVEDHTNEDLAFARNRIRRQVLPALEASVPGASRAAARLAEIMADEEEWLERLVQADLAQIAASEEHPGAVALDVRQFRERPRALRSRLLRAAAEQVRGHLRGLARAHIEAVLDGIVAGSETSCDLPGLRVRLEGARLRLLPLEGRRLAWPANDDDGENAS